MPQKIRQLKALLRQAGWVHVPGGKGSHSKWQHPRVGRTLILSGNDGDDAARYQERDVEQAVRDTKGQ